MEMASKLLTMAEDMEKALKRASGQAGTPPDLS
jgi:hypothetical protein